MRAVPRTEGQWGVPLRKVRRRSDTFLARFVVIVKNGRPGKQMPPWKNVLDEDNISKIGAYLETLALEGANWK